MRLKALFILLLTFISAQAIFCQEEYSVEVKSVDKKQGVLQKYKYNTKPKDSLTAINTVNELVSALRNDGYLLASLDKYDWKDSHLSTEVYVGEIFKWAYLDLSKVDPLILEKSKVKSKQFSGKALSPKAITSLENSFLNLTENNGYPFASMQLDSITVSNQELAASVRIESGPYILFDSVSASISSPLSSRFLGAYLGIREGDRYRQSVVEATVRKLSQLPYVKLEKAPEVVFKNDRAQMSFDLSKRPVNTVDGIIGFLPNNARGGGLLITGQFDMDLFNPFRSGKHIGLHWRRLSEETQQLQVDYKHPNLFSSALSLEGEFHFLKQDSTFTRRDFNLEFSYPLSSVSSIHFFGGFRGTDLLATSLFQNATQLPDVIDYDLSHYGLAFELNRLDDPIIPNDGEFLSVGASVGTRKIIPNADLPLELYANQDLRNLQYQYDIQFQKYYKLGSKLTLVNKVNAGLISNDQLFINDAFRLGGLNTIRGFNEGDIFATEYAFTNIEARYFLDASSYLLLFTDLGLYKSDFSTFTERDNLLGLGAGLTFSTNTGIFNFVYALGSSKETGAINFNQSKIHFGFTTRF